MLVQCLAMGTKWQCMPMGTKVQHSRHMSAMRQKVSFLNVSPFKPAQVPWTYFFWTTELILHQYTAYSINRLINCCRLCILASKHTCKMCNIFERCMKYSIFNSTQTDIKMILQSKGKVQNRTRGGSNTCWVVIASKVLQILWNRKPKLHILVKWGSFYVFWFPLSTTLFKPALCFTVVHGYLLKLNVLDFRTLEALFLLLRFP